MQESPEPFGDLDEDPSPGWTAIEQALQRLYPGVEPLNFGPIIQYEQGGPDPLEGTSVYPSQRWVDHWHYVTFGFSELHQKVSLDSELSGFGFELSLRLRRDPETPTPPSWPVDLLQSLARYVFSTGNAFDEDHHMDLDGPLALGLETSASAIALRLDPELGALNSPHGRIKFLQVVALTADELEAVRAWCPAPFLDLLELGLPGLVIDPQRPSLLREETLRAQVEERTALEGSSQEVAFVPSLAWSCPDEEVHLAFDASTVENLRRLLEGRTRHGRAFLLVRGEQQLVEVVPGPEFAWHVDPEHPLLTLTCPPALVQRLLDELQAQPGHYRWPEAPGLVLQLC